ncbi:ADP-ribosylglycohydrolase family protein [Arachnia propionica]|uniref:ADP-ribosylglycohydrolase family protein n=1 Tax=Arachnia propionica TaxID=1750 RepID=A0A3P1T5W8_9ACTN|nr:ADP-ribosylglycohydrolase family protein [Arachnia propionica]RRD04595.1 ADP-ribosylglycohydrolase family protein [Arachnia propionica]
MHEDRILGCLLGLAAGDALGTTVEFQPRGSFPEVTDIVGGGVFDLEAGQWTDDTSMTLCLATSLVEMGGHDPRDQLERFRRWYRDGYLSSTGSCFDIGNQTVAALLDFEATGEPYRPYAGEGSAGNGSLMRVAPLVLAYWRDPATAIRLSGDHSRTTHPARACVESCEAFGELLAAAVAGASKPELFALAMARAEQVTTPRLAEILAGSFRGRDRDAISSSGHVLDSLEAALWAFDATDDFASAVRLAVNLGDDADTVGAICGALAGAFHGSSGIPERWRNRLHDAQLIEKLGLALARGIWSVEALAIP